MVDPPLGKGQIYSLVLCLYIGQNIKQIRIWIPCVDLHLSSPWAGSISSWSHELQDISFPERTQIYETELLRVPTWNTRCVFASWNLAFSWCQPRPNTSHALLRKAIQVEWRRPRLWRPRLWQDVGPCNRFQQVRADVIFRLFASPAA